MSTAFLYGRRQNIVLPLADVLWVYRHDLKLLWAKSTVVELLTYDGRSITLQLKRGGSRRTADAIVQAVSARNPEALVGLNREISGCTASRCPTPSGNGCGPQPPASAAACWAMSLPGY